MAGSTRGKAAVASLASERTGSSRSGVTDTLGRTSAGAGVFGTRVVGATGAVGTAALGDPAAGRFDASSLSSAPCGVSPCIGARNGVAGATGALPRSSSLVFSLSSLAPLSSLSPASLAREDIVGTAGTATGMTSTPRFSSSTVEAGGRPSSAGSTRNGSAWTSSAWPLVIKPVMPSRKNCASGLRRVEKVIRSSSKNIMPRLVSAHILLISSHPDVRHHPGTIPLQHGWRLTHDGTRNGSPPRSQRQE